MLKKSILILLVALFIAVTLPHSGYAGNAQEESSRYIVVYENATPEHTRDEILDRAGAHTLKKLSSGARVANLSKESRSQLTENPNVLRIEKDELAFASKRPTNPTNSSSEQTPWGISKIKAPESWSTGRGAGSIVAVVDTGIDLDHPDLINNITLGYNAISPGTTSDDNNGHGTHVAGTIAGVDNTIGVIGVAPSARLLSVKVLGANGSGYISDIIEGIDWAVANGADVINMSLGTTADIQSMEDAVVRAFNAGVVVVAASGNDGSAVNYPAAYPTVLAVGATDSNNTIASWSSRGPQVDLSAPGVSVYSTYKGSVYKTLSGTSMATPHVAGLAAVLSTLVTPCDTDHNGSCSPIEIETRMKATATDLGTTGVDTIYGSGLINMYAATR